MRIIEERMISKTGDPSLCEDRYCVTEHFACVIDGASNTSGKTFHGLNPGQIISQVIEETIYSLHFEWDIDQIIQTINANLTQYYKENGLYEYILENPPSCPTASMILYSKHRRTIWMIGDCHCLIDGKWHTNEKQVDQIIAEARALYLEAEIQRGKTIEQLLHHDTSMDVVRPFKKMQYYLQNSATDTQYSYIAITGFDFDLKKIKTIHVDCSVRELVLASDGYPWLKPSLEETEAALDYILEHDPLCFREYKLAKGLKRGNLSFDDRTFLRVKLI